MGQLSGVEGTNGGEGCAVGLRLRSRNLRERSIVHDARGGIADVEEKLKERPVLDVGLDAAAERVGVLEGRQRTVDAAQNLAQKDLVGRALELVATVRAADADDDAHALEVAQDRLQELLRQLLFLSNVADPDRLAGRVSPSQDDERLQGVEAFLGDPHAQ